jgi:hypothetical protein
MTPMPGSLVSTRSSFSAASGGAVGDAHLAGVQRAADADAATVVDRHPGGAGGGVDQGVEQRPVGDRVGAVEHRLGLAVGRGHRAAVEVVAADDDRGAETSPRRDEVVERQPGLVALAVAEPADPRRQALEGDALLRHRRSTVQAVVVGEEVETAWSVAAMSLGSPESATQRNGPLPSQNSGRM